MTPKYNNFPDREYDNDVVSIETPHGTILIDESDEHLLGEYRWFVKKWANQKGIYVYERYTKGQKQRWLHRVIMDAPKDKFVDHINGNTLDNRRCNLRLATHLENSRNRKMSTRANMPSKYKGVQYWKRTGRSGKVYNYWTMVIIVEGKKLRKICKSEIEAAELYNEYAKKYFGEFARLNEI